MSDIGNPEFEKQSESGSVPCTCSQCQEQCQEQHPDILTARQREKIPVLFCQTCTLKQLSLAVSKNNFKMSYSKSSLNSKYNISFKQFTVFLLSSSNDLECIHTKKQDCYKKAIIQRFPRNLLSDLVENASATAFCITFCKQLGFLWTVYKMQKCNIAFIEVVCHTTESHGIRCCI